MVGSMAKLEILGDEFEIDDAAAPVLDPPQKIGLVLLIDARAHLRHIGHQLGRIAPAAQRMPDCLGNLVAKFRRAGDDPRPA